MNTLQATVGDISVGYRVFGSGDPLVLIMGYGSTMNLWEPALISALATRYKVIILDNRGIGFSGSGNKPFSLEQFSDDVAGLMDALGLQQAHVLGWSMGALIAQELALRHPSKVSSLILYAAHCGAEMFPPRPEIIQLLMDTSGTLQERGMRYISVLFPAQWLQRHGERIGEIFYRPLGNIPEETPAKQAMAIGTWQGSSSRLGDIRSPVLLITGTEDCLTIPQNAIFMSEKIADARLALIENGGHGLIFQYPDVFCQHVLDFLTAR